MSAIEIAKSVLERAGNTGKNYAVFVRNGRVNVTNTGTALYREALEKRGSDLLGIYNSQCFLDWIVDDLNYKGVI
jgi:hypothetical protein